MNLRRTGTRIAFGPSAGQKMLTLQGEMSVAEIVMSLMKNVVQHAPGLLLR